MQRRILFILFGIALAALVALPSSVDVAFAQAGHFIEQGAGQPVCRDAGLVVVCTGKVAGLGGTTFEITVEATGVAEVECENPGGNVAPGQDTTITATATSGPLPTPRSGQFVFSLSTAVPTVPNFPTCPNPQWTATVVDVTFTSPATISLFEDNVLVDVVEVAIQS